MDSAPKLILRYCGARRPHFEPKTIRDGSGILQVRTSAGPARSHEMPGNGGTASRDHLRRQLPERFYTRALSLKPRASDILAVPLELWGCIQAAVSEIGA
jgi:hypothetical protein